MARLESRIERVVEEKKKRGFEEKVVGQHRFIYRLAEPTTVHQRAE
jgi:hypothetical protein